MEASRFGLGAFILATTLAFLACFSFAQTLGLPGYEKVPLRLSDDGHFLMKSRVKRQNIVFVVDTGAPTGILDRTKATQLGLKPVGGFADVARERAVILPNLTSHNMRFGNITIAVGPGLPQGQSMLYQGDFDSIHGLLGGDLLARYNAIIDCRNRELFLKNRSEPGRKSSVSTILRSAGYVQVPFRRNHWLYVPLELRGRKFSALIDTGSAVTVLRGRMVSRMGLRPEASDMWVRGIGFGSRHMRIVTEDQHDLTIGGVPIRLAFNTVSGPDFFGSQPRNFIGIVGTGLLIRHGAVIDYGHNTLWLRPD